MASAVQYDQTTEPISLQGKLLKALLNKTIMLYFIACEKGLRPCRKYRRKHFTVKVLSAKTSGLIADSWQTNFLSPLSKFEHSRNFRNSLEKSDNLLKKWMTLFYQHDPKDLWQIYQFLSWKLTLRSSLILSLCPLWRSYSLQLRKRQIHHHCRGQMVGKKLSSNMVSAVKRTHSETMKITDIMELFWVIRLYDVACRTGEPIVSYDGPMFKKGNCKWCIPTV